MLNQQQPSPITYLNQCKESIQQSFSLIDEIEEYYPDEQESQKAATLPDEPKHVVEPRIITQADTKRVMESMDKIFAQLNLITPTYSDPKYLCFDQTNERTKRQVLSRFQQIWDQIKLQQKERFNRYSDEIIFQQMSQLDGQLNENYEYSLQYQARQLNKVIQIKYHDVMKLNPPNYLNDGIINFYLKFIEFELLDEELRSKTYIFNTYFMEKLCQWDKLQNLSDNHRISEMFKQNYELVKRWVRDDLLEKEYLLFPINLPEHWSLLIVYKPSKSFADSIIIYLDSFGIIDQKLITIVKMYLHKFLQSEQNYNDSPIKQIPAYQLLVPRQFNYVDCGAFLLEYAESFLSNPNYLIKDIDTVDGIYKLRLFPRTLATKRRLLMKQLLIELVSLNKEEAIKNYKQRRQEIIEQCVSNDDEYDQIDKDLFKEFLQQKNCPNPNPELLKSYLLDFYMNPSQNYYEQQQ